MGIYLIVALNVHISKNDTRGMGGIMNTVKIVLIMSLLSSSTQGIGRWTAQPLKQPTLPVATRSLTTSTSDASHPKRAIIVGASSGMGREVAKLLAADGYIVGLAARRLPLLESLQKEIPTPTYIKQIDASKPEEAINHLNELIQEIGGLDLIILSVTGFREVDWTNRDWTADKAVFDVDIIGFYALARTALNLFEQQGYGHLVGFSSLDGLRGIGGCPSYSASKAFCSRYMEAERNRCMQLNLPITITDIMPGWVNSQEDPDFKKKNPKAYWVDSLPDASQEIFAAIKNKVPVAYITQHWQQVADVLKIMPDELYNALGGL